MPASEPNHPNADVRMRGFAQRATVEEALAWIDSALLVLGQLGISSDGIDGRGFRVASIPEPSTLLLVALAGMGLLRRRHMLRTPYLTVCLTPNHGF